MTPPFRATVTDTGGGAVHMLVARDTMEYPADHAYVEVRVLCEETGVHDCEHGKPTPKGWTAEEARKRTLVQRLHERCAVYAGDVCSERLPHDEWCERCLAAEVIASLQTMAAGAESFLRLMSKVLNADACATARQDREADAAVEEAAELPPYLVARIEANRADPSRLRRRERPEPSRSEPGRHWAARDADWQAARVCAECTHESNYHLFAPGFMDADRDRVCEIIGCSCDAFRPAS